MIKIAINCYNLYKMLYIAKFALQLSPESLEPRPLFATEARPGPKTQKKTRTKQCWRKTKKLVELDICLYMLYISICV